VAGHEAVQGTHRFTRPADSAGTVLKHVLLVDHNQLNRVGWRAGLHHVGREAITARERSAAVEGSLMIVDWRLTPRSFRSIARSTTNLENALTLQVAKYDGSGSTEASANFACVDSSAR
jgi:hypothetical protein